MIDRKSYDDWVTFRLAADHAKLLKLSHKLEFFDFGQSSRDETATHSRKEESESLECKRITIICIHLWVP